MAQAGVQLAVVDRDRAHQQVGMAGGVLGHGLDADVDAMRQRAKRQPRRPGVVHHRQHAARSTGGGQGRNIDDLEGQGRRRLDQQQPRPLAAQSQDVGSRGVRRMEVRHDPARGQVPGQEAAGRAINGVAGHHLVARVQQGQQSSQARAFCISRYTTSRIWMRCFGIWHFG